jgi:deoxycytidylate deaminase
LKVRKLMSELLIRNLPNSWRRGFEAAEAASIYSDGVKLGERLGAALFAGPRIMSLGYNVWAKSHPASRHPKFDRCVHAEHMSLIKRRHYVNSNNLVMYVYRAKRENFKDAIAACSRPCKNCCMLLELANVRRVRFIDENGIPAEMRL